MAVPLQLTRRASGVKSPLPVSASFASSAASMGHGFDSALCSVCLRGRCPENSP